LVPEGTDVFTDSQVRYIAKESMGIFLRMKGMGIVSTLIMSVALMMLALFTLATLNLRGLAQSFRDEIEIDVFVKEGTSDDAVQALHERLAHMSGVTSVHFVSKDDALAEFRTQLGDDSDLLDVLEENPLPASMRLTLREDYRQSDRLSMLAGYMRELPEVDEVRYGDQWVARLEQYIRIFTALDVLVGVIVLLSALFVISNTVRLTVMARARTIEIMRLVGATNWFIRLPFVLEGAVQGGVAGGIAMGVLWAAHRYASRYVHQLVFYDGVQVAGFVTLCAVVCIAGSLTSLRRFLRL
jgi:cell division transport system permease protein